MFDLNFNNPEGFLIAFIPALLNLGVVTYIFFFLPENRVTNVFAMLTIALVCWQTNDAILRVSDTAIVADKWDTIFCTAWIMVGPLCLHFALLYSEVIKEIRARTVLILLYLPGFAFITIYASHVFPHHYEFDSLWGYVNYHQEHWLDIVMIYWISVLVIVATALLGCRTYRVRHDKMLMRQSLIIAAGIGIPTVSGLIGQVIMPLLMDQPAIPFASTFMTMFSLATVISLGKYRLFSVNETLKNEALIEDMPVMIFIISEKKRLSYINYSGAEILKINKNDIGILPLTKLFQFPGAESQKKFFDGYDKALKEKSVFSFETAFSINGSRMDVTVSCKPIINNNQVMGVLFAARDISELKRYNEWLQHNEKLLEEAQQIAHLGSWEWDIKSNKVTWSDELKRIYGLPELQSEITSATFFATVPEAEKEKIKEIIYNGFYERLPFNLFTNVIRADETHAVLHIRGKVVTDNKGRVVKMTGTGQDVTEQMHKEEMLRKQNEELKKINHELDRFVYMVSHDLRAPLLSMQGVAELTEEYTKEELTSKHIQMIKSSIRKMDTFIGDILEYSRNARIEVRSEEIDFNSMISEIKGSLQYMGGNRPVDVIADVNQMKPFCSDKKRLMIVLNNLVSNSIRYQNENAENPFVRIRVLTNVKSAVIEVEDNGIGIKDKHQNKVFEMFYRVSDKSKGSGLGLYIVKEIVEKLRGNIQLNSTMGVGTKFSFTIPNLYYS